MKPIEETIKDIQLICKKLIKEGYECSYGDTVSPYLFVVPEGVTCALRLLSARGLTCSSKEHINGRVAMFIAKSNKE